MSMRTEFWMEALQSQDGLWSEEYDVELTKDREALVMMLPTERRARSMELPWCAELLGWVSRRLTSERGHGWRSLMEVPLELEGVYEKLGSCDRAKWGSVVLPVAEMALIQRAVEQGDAMRAVLEERLCDPQQHTAGRARALRVLATPESVRALWCLASSKDERVRFEAVRALGHLGAGCGLSLGVEGADQPTAAFAKGTSRAALRAALGECIQIWAAREEDPYSAALGWSQTVLGSVRLSAKDKEALTGAVQGAYASVWFEAEEQALRACMNPWVNRSGSLLARAFLCAQEAYDTYRKKDYEALFLELDVRDPVWAVFFVEVFCRPKWQKSGDWASWPYIAARDRSLLVSVFTHQFLHGLTGPALQWYTRVYNILHASHEPMETHLGSMRSDFLPLHVRALRHANASVRNEARDILARMGERVLPILDAAMEGAKSGTLVACFQTLSRIATPKAGALLTRRVFPKASKNVLQEYEHAKRACGVGEVLDRGWYDPWEDNASVHELVEVLRELVHQDDPLGSWVRVYDIHNRLVMRDAADVGRSYLESIQLGAKRSAPFPNLPTREESPMGVLSWFPVSMLADRVQCDAFAREVLPVEEESVAEGLRLDWDRALRVYRDVLPRAFAWLRERDVCPTALEMRVDGGRSPFSARGRVVSSMQLLEGFGVVLVACEGVAISGGSKMTQLVRCRVRVPKGHAMFADDHVKNRIDTKRFLDLIPLIR